jgi:hypothetical protein
VAGWRRQWRHVAEEVGALIGGEAWGRGGNGGAGWRRQGCSPVVKRCGAWEEATLTGGEARVGRGRGTHRWGGADRRRQGCMGRVGEGRRGDLGTWGGVVEDEACGVGRHRVSQLGARQGRFVGWARPFGSR